MAGTPSQDPELRDIYLQFVKDDVLPERDELVVMEGRGGDAHQQQLGGGASLAVPPMLGPGAALAGGSSLVAAAAAAGGTTWVTHGISQMLLHGPQAPPPLLQGTGQLSLTASQLASVFTTASMLRPMAPMAAPGYAAAASTPVAAAAAAAQQPVPAASTMAGGAQQQQAAVGAGAGDGGAGAGAGLAERLGLRQGANKIQQRREALRAVGALLVPYETVEKDAAEKKAAAGQTASDAAATAASTAAAAAAVDAARISHAGAAAAAAGAPGIIAGILESTALVSVVVGGPPGAPLPPPPLATTWQDRPVPGRQHAFLAIADVPGNRHNPTGGNRNPVKLPLRPGHPLADLHLLVVAIGGTRCAHPGCTRGGINCVGHDYDLVTKYQLGFVVKPSWAECKPISWGKGKGGGGQNKAEGDGEGEGEGPWIRTQASAVLWHIKGRVSAQAAAGSMPGAAAAAAATAATQPQPARQTRAGAAAPVAGAAAANASGATAAAMGSVAPLTARAVASAADTPQTSGGFMLVDADGAAKVQPATRRSVTGSRSGGGAVSGSVGASGHDVRGGQLLSRLLKRSHPDDWLGAAPEQEAQRHGGRMRVGLGSGLVPAPGTRQQVGCVSDPAARQLTALEHSVNRVWNFLTGPSPTAEGFAKLLCGTHDTDGIPLEHLRDRNFVCRDLQLRKNNNKLRSPDERLSPMLGLAHMLVLPRAALRGEGVEARVQDAPDSAEELRQEEEQAIGMVKALIEYIEPATWTELLERMHDGTAVHAAGRYGYRQQLLEACVLPYASRSALLTATPHNYLPLHSALRSSHEGAGRLLVRAGLQLADELGRAFCGRPEVLPRCIQEALEVTGTAVSAGSGSPAAGGRGGSSNSSGAGGGSGRGYPPEVVAQAIAAEMVYSLRNKYFRGECNELGFQPPPGRSGEALLVRVCRQLMPDQQPAAAAARPAAGGAAGADASAGAGVGAGVEAAAAGRVVARSAAGPLRPFPAPPPSGKTAKAGVLGELRALARQQDQQQPRTLAAPPSAQQDIPI